MKTTLLVLMAVGMVSLPTMTYSQDTAKQDQLPLTNLSPAQKNALMVELALGGAQIISQTLVEKEDANGPRNLYARMKAQAELLQREADQYSGCPDCAVQQNVLGNFCKYVQKQFKDKAPKATEGISEDHLSQGDVQKALTASWNSNKKFLGDNCSKVTDADTWAETMVNDRKNCYSTCLTAQSKKAKDVDADAAISGLCGGYCDTYIQMTSAFGHAYVAGFGLGMSSGSGRVGLPPEGTR